MEDDGMDLIRQALRDGNQTPISQGRLPDWAAPTDREENYSHAVRHLFETGLDHAVCYGPEAAAGDRKIDVVVEARSLSGTAASESIYIGIEVKRKRNAASSGSNLRQFGALTQTGQFDYLLLCVPSDKTYIPGNLSQAWGLLLFDPETGEVTLEDKPERLTRSEVPSCVSEFRITEADITHGVWVDRSRTLEDVTVEVVLPATKYQPEDRGSMGSRVDIYGKDQGSRFAVEAKGMKLEPARLKDQLAAYNISTNVNLGYLAVPDPIRSEAESFLQEEAPEVGLMVVSAPKSVQDREVRIERSPSRIKTQHSRSLCPDCGKEYNNRILGEDRECPWTTCSNVLD